MMKKYACHRVYTRPDHYLKQAFITINEQGNLINYAPFSEEIRNTEWIGGVIVLSDSEKTPGNNWHSWIREHTKDAGHLTYAWHFSEFDFEREEPTPTCVARRL